MQAGQTEHTTPPMAASSAGDYVPVAGDVVEFEDEGRNGTGILFIAANYNNKLGIAYGSHPGWDVIDTLGGIKKIGRCKEIPTVPKLWSDIAPVVKAYFSAPVLKVGDKVRVIKQAHSLVPEVGVVTTVVEVDDSGSIWLKDSGCTSSDCLELAQPVLTGSYAEKQAQWIAHHGLKVGDKVKVVKRFARKADGSQCDSWNYSSGKEDMQGRVCEINEICGTFIWLWCTDVKSNVDCFPYTALEPVSK